MDSLILSDFKPKTKTVDGRTMIYDGIRKDYFVLTPEELVRQSFIMYLTEQLGYPRAMILVEKQVKTGNKPNRSDIRVMDQQGDCFLLIECKSFKSNINQATFDQASKYSHSLKAPYVVVTNGITTLCCSIDYDAGKFDFQETLPEYPRN